MPEFRYNMKVEHLESLRFQVESRGKKTADTYLVDLEEHGGNGQCGCENFHFRLGRLLNQGAPISADTRCHHIKAAREWFLDRIIEKQTKGKQ